MMEEWRPVVGYEGLYEVSNTGQVRSLDKYDTKGRFLRGKTLKLLECTNGYLMIGLNKNGIRKVYLVHRLVAEAFIERFDGLYEVNHKDENKKNNSVDNLEWCSKKYNNNYGTKIERQKRTMFNLGYWKEGNNNKDRNRKYYYLHRDDILQKKREKYKNSK